MNKIATQFINGLQVCQKCILPSTFPGISFDENGTCNFCTNYRGEKATDAIKKKYEHKFLELVAKNRHASKGSYDVLMAYSGGKDSTYTLDLFVNRYKLKTLALTFDNSFISEQSFSNMKTVCDNLSVDHLIIRPNKQILHKIFRAAATQELFSTKTLERASTICTSCIGMVKSIILRTALEKGIYLIGFGWSPGQAPVQASVMKTNASLMRSTQKAIMDPLYTVVKDSINPFFVTEDQFSSPETFPWNIHPLAFLDYNEEKILKRNNTLGWQRPDDTDQNSTNCQLNAYANRIHMDRYQFHPYAWEIANMVRAGVLDRDEGVVKIYTAEDERMVQYAKNQLQN